MNENTLLSQSAEAENGIENEMRALLMGCIEVDEIILPMQSMKMKIKQLEAFCQRKPELPLFQIRVESTSSGIISLQRKPFLKIFTIWNNCCLFAEEPIKVDKEAVKMEGGELLVA